MATCPKCGKVLKEDDYIVEKIKIKLPYAMTIGNFGIPVSCRHCGTLLGFIS